MSDAAHSGNANLPIGVSDQDQREQADERIGGAIHDPREDANREIGVPGGGPGWHGRGYLPHFDRSEVTQHVTFHLVDSLAKETLERMEAELRTLPLHRQDVERRKKIEAWIDAGHGSCVLRDPVIATMVQDVFRFFHGQRYRLLAWVIMPNHVHVLFQPIDGWTVAKIVASWKKFTAKPISHHRKALRNANLLIGVGDEAANREIGVGNEAAHREIGVGDEAAHREIGGPERGEPIWHREYWDRYMRDEEHFRQAVGYIHDNPVKAGPVANAEDWRWSSACPGNAGNAHREIGVGDEEANREIGGPGKGS